MDNGVRSHSESDENAADEQERTRTFWKARRSQGLTAEEAREIEENVTGFFEVLAQWDTVVVKPNESGAERRHCGSATSEQENT